MKNCQTNQNGDTCYTITSLYTSKCQGHKDKGILETTPEKGRIKKWQLNAIFNPDQTKMIFCYKQYY